MTKSKSHTYKFPRPALTVDIVVFGLDLEEDDLRVLLIRRGVEPFLGDWALPGGHVLEDEDLAAAARRELTEETGLGDVFLEQLYTFGGPQRDPRGHYVTVAYYALVNLLDHDARAATDAADVGWFSLTDLPRLAFDHEEITETAVERLRGKVRYQPIGFELLPEEFTLTQLQRVYEVVLDRALDKRNFRKKIQAMEILQDTGRVEKDVARRAAKLYRFQPEIYREKEQMGFTFEI